MASIYLDEDIDEDLIVELEQFGHVVRHARVDPGMKSASDAAQLLHAALLGSCFITHNRKDFRLLHDAWRRWPGTWGGIATHWGVLTVTQGQPASSLAEVIQEPFSQDFALVNEMYE